MKLSLFLISIQLLAGFAVGQTLPGTTEPPMPLPDCNLCISVCSSNPQVGCYCSFATFVPIESVGGPGTTNSHWQEAYFFNELMTGYINKGIDNPITPITIGGLVDLGYTVDWASPNIDYTYEIPPVQKRSKGDVLEYEMGEAPELTMYDTQEEYIAATGRTIEKRTGWTINLIYQSEISAEIQADFESAKTIWESIIMQAGPQPDVTISVIMTDLPDNILGMAGPTNAYFDGTYFRVVEGIMQFDTPYFEGEFASQRATIILHEMGHVLGIGVFWTYLGFYQFNSFKYYGTGAVEGMLQVLGNSPSPYAQKCEGTPPSVCHVFTDFGGPSGNYINGQDQVYTLCSESGISQAVFHQFDIESHPTCDFDYMMVYDGDSTSAPMMTEGSIEGRFCGFNAPEYFQSTNAGGCLTFSFHSDNSIVASGWYADIYCLGTSEPMTISPITDHQQTAYPTTLAPTPDEATKCDSFVDRGGVSGDYAAYEDYVQTFCSPTGAIQAIFTMFDVEYDPQCIWDFMTVHDGRDPSAPMIYKRTSYNGLNCGFDLPGPFMATNWDGCLTFVFHSDTYLQGAGWEADIYCIPSSNPRPVYFLKFDGAGPLLVNSQGIPSLSGMDQIYLEEVEGDYYLSSPGKGFMKCTKVFCWIVPEMEQADAFAKYQLVEGVWGLQMKDSNKFICNNFDKLRLCTRAAKMTMFTHSPPFMAGPGPY